MENQQFPPVLLTFRQFSDKHQAFSEPALRHIRFGATSRQSSKGPVKVNGFARAFVNVGRKVLIDERAFFGCVAAQNAQGGES